MCGRMIILTYDEVLDVLQSVQAGPDNPYPDWPARAPKDAYPTDEVPVVSALDASAFEGAVPPIQIMSWGFPVEWQPAPVFNTRIESIIANRGMWKGPAADGRCLVPTRGFYERHATQKVRSPRTGRQVKRQFEFTLVDEPVTWLAGISENGHFSVVTTEPNRFVAPVHNRMPLVLRREELPLWLDGDFARLSDRSDVEFRVVPEDETAADTNDAGGQMSLF